MGQFGLVLRYFSLFALCVVNRCQLGCRTILLCRNGRVKLGQDVGSNDTCRVTTACLQIGAELRQHIELDIVERTFHSRLVEHLVQITVVIGCLTTTLSSHQIVVSINSTCTRLRIVCFQKLLISLCCFLGFIQSLHSHSTHDFDTSLIFVEIFDSCIITLTIFVQQHLRAVNPIDGFCITTGIDIRHTGIYRSQYSLLETTTGLVCLPTVGIMTTGSIETLLSLSILTKVQLTAADIVQEDGIVDVRTDTRLVHTGYSRYRHTQRTFIIAFYQQQFRQTTSHLVVT